MYEADIGKSCSNFMRKGLARFCAGMLLHRHAFAPACFCAGMLLRRHAFPPARFSTDMLCHRHALPPASFSTGDAISPATPLHQRRFAQVRNLLRL